ncbi:hypothetical protein JW905_14005 [bacterium]|nr:hypothetical protein [candidate division CSSED10-310 bacterium]
MSEKRWRRIRSELKNAFAVRSEERVLTAEEEALLDTIAGAIVKRSLTVPALMFLETIKPLNMVGSQIMAFFEPFADSLLKGKGYSMLRDLLEDRRCVSTLIERIERLDREQLESRRRKTDVASEGDE